MNDQKIELTLNLVNAVLNYLGSRPYGEVAPLVQEIQAQAIPQVQMPASVQAPQPEAAPAE